MRLIDADRLYDKAEEKYKGSSGFYRPIYRGFVDDIADAPTIEATPVVHGRWVKPYINRYGHPCHCCSVCDFHASYQDKNYCPSCGAKMDGGTNGKT